MGERREDSKVKDREVNELLNAYHIFRDKLKRIIDPTTRYVLFIGFLNEWFKNRGLGYIVVTGGFAVELLTGKVYRTLDIDLITSNKLVADILEAFLRKISERIGRGYLPLYEEIAIKSIDIVSTVYSRLKAPLIIHIDNYEVYIDPPEELIISYLAGWKYWNSTLDRDKAFLLLSVLYEKLDKEYLYRRAKDEKVNDKLEELLRYLKTL